MAESTNEVHPAITTRELNLVDKDGRMCACLTTNEDGQPAILMYDTNNNLRLLVMLKPNGDPSVTLKSDSREINIHISEEKNNCGISLSDTASDKMCAAVLGHMPFLVLTDEGGEVRSALTIKDGKGALILNDSNSSADKEISSE